MQMITPLDPVDCQPGERVWRLLLVDDCREDRETFRRYLLADRTRRYQIWEAESGEEALALCRDRHWDLVLLDLQLPDISGMEVWEYLRAHPTVRPPTTILLTAFGDEGLAVRALKSGVADYIVKTQLAPETLQWAVRAAVEQACLQTRLQQVRHQRQFIAGLALRVCQGVELQDTLKVTVAEVCGLLACDRVAVFQADVGTNTSTLICDAGRSVAPVPSQPASDGRGGGATLGAFTSGFTPDQRAYLEQFTHATTWVLPIAWEDQTLTGGPIAHLWGVLVACRQVQHWQPDEIELLEELATQLAIATRHAEMLARLETALSRERELNAVKSQIVTTVSHEYRTPLAAILAAATTLKNHDRRLAPGMQAHLLATIEQRAKHLGHLVEDMLLVEQHNRDRGQLRLERISLETFFRSLLEEQRLAEALAYARVKLIFSGDLENFWADRQHLSQIFSNLLSNALKYSDDASEVTVCVAGTEAQLTVEVIDRGIGIPSSDRPQVFQSFARGSNVGTIPGTGLGLFIVRTYVELHNGTITLASQEGSGTTITVQLPKQQ